MKSREVGGKSGGFPEHTEPGRMINDCCSPAGS